MKVSDLNMIANLSSSRSANSPKTSSLNLVNKTVPAKSPATVTQTDALKRKL